MSYSFYDAEDYDCFGQRKQKVGQTVKDLLLCFVGLVVIIGIFFGMVYYSTAKSCKEWNNGYCQCGGYWRYDEAVGHRSSTTYMYECDRCGRHIERNSIEEEVQTETGEVNYVNSN